MQQTDAQELHCAA